MAKTAVFFHPVMARGDWPIIGGKFAGFPEAFGKLLEDPEVVLVESPLAPEEILLACHDPRYLQGVKGSWYWEGASRSVGGCLRAVEGVMKGEFRNALVFTVAAGHHASRAHGWGGTYLSCAGPALYHLRKNKLARRIAILDTDAHHGDGTRSFVEGDPEVLHVCFCHTDYVGPDGTKVDVAVPYGIGDDGYLEKVRGEFCRRARAFGPEMILHNFGHDTAKGDYGDRGLSPSFFRDLALLVKELAEEICQGRYVVITHGGARRDLAQRVYRDVLEVLRG